MAVLCWVLPFIFFLQSPPPAPPAWPPSFLPTPGSFTFSLASPRLHTRVSARKTLLSLPPSPVNSGSSWSSEAAPESAAGEARRGAGRSPLRLGSPGIAPPLPPGPGPHNRSDSPRVHGLREGRDPFALVSAGSLGHRKRCANTQRMNQRMRGWNSSY